MNYSDFRNVLKAALAYFSWDKNQDALDALQQQAAEALQLTDKAEQYQAFGRIRQETKRLNDGYVPTLSSKIVGGVTAAGTVTGLAFGAAAIREFLPSILWFFGASVSFVKGTDYLFTANPLLKSQNENYAAQRIDLIDQLLQGQKMLLNYHLDDMQRSLSFDALLKNDRHVKQAFDRHGQDKSRTITNGALYVVRRDMSA